MIDDRIRLWNRDSFEFCKSIDDNHYDLLICDPPYGIGRSESAGKSKRHEDKKWDDESPSQEFFDELIRVSKNQIIWGANHFIQKIPYPSQGWICWDKRENIIPERTFSDFELAWTSFDVPARMFRHYWDGFMQRNKEKREHPTHKPTALYRWLLTRYAKEGDKILDPFGGSFSVALACYDMGYQLDAIELDKEYFDKGVRRFNEHKAQLKMF
jgi:site-specific DNA-methyltransferase (adenine-specific)